MLTANPSELQQFMVHCGKQGDFTIFSDEEFP